MQVAALRAMAKERGIKGASSMRKAQLIEILLPTDGDRKTENTVEKTETAEELAQEKTEEKHATKNVRRTSGRKAGSNNEKQSGSNNEKQAGTNNEKQSGSNNEKQSGSNNEKQAEKKNENHTGTRNEKQTAEKNDKKVEVKNDKKKDRKTSEKKIEKNNQEKKSSDEYKQKKNNGRMHQNRRGRNSENSQAGAENAEKAQKAPDESPVEAAREQAEIPRYKDARPCRGMLEVLPDGFGFLRGNGYTTDENDVYVSPSQIRRFRLRTGDVITGETRKNNPTDKFGALLFMDSVNGISPDENARRTPFEKLTPVFPNERIRLEREGGSAAARIVDLVSPIGKGQRGMIVSQPKAGKTTLLKEVAISVMQNNPEIHLIILLIDERPEEVTDMKETIAKANADNKVDVEVVASTFDETPENHKRISEIVIDHARRMVESKQDVMILLDSITRLARAYNLTVPPSGKTLSGGLDPTALYMPKRFFGAARNMREGGSLTILATALVDTGSRMDDVVYEEFKGTGNMELVLDRSLSERRIFPAIDLAKSSTRRDDMLFTREEMVAMNIVRRALSGVKGEEATEQFLNLISHTKTNYDFCREVVRMRVL
ncbi:MAG: transcription termination factor Rho [Lachnospiraceae bacterium]|nr:MAG: transcription termination factor Rho [Lachnospiraceae bacterium]